MTQPPTPADGFPQGPPTGSFPSERPRDAQGETFTAPHPNDPQAGPPAGWVPVPPPAANWGPPPGPAGAPTPWGPPQQWSPPPAPPVLPVVATEYPSFWRAPGIALWKPVVAVILGAIGFLVLSFVVVLGAVVGEAAVTGRPFLDEIIALGEGSITAVTFLANSVSLGLLIPLTFVLSRLVGQRGGWISSVVGRIRWRWLLKCFGVSVAAVVVLVVVTTTIDGWANQGLELRPGWWWLLIGVIIVTPFQAAGEEYLMRGLLNRAVATFFSARILGAVLGALVSSVVFMFIHGAGDIWLNITYFGLGMLFSYLAWRTGGLEAAIAMHIANNIVVLLFLPFQDLSSVFDRSAGVGDASALVQLAMLGAAAFVIVRMARGASIERSGPPDAVAPLVPDATLDSANHR